MKTSASTWAIALAMTGLLVQPAWSQQASAPKSRGQVKAEAEQAIKHGDNTPMGEADPNNHASPGARPKKAKPAPERPQKKASAAATAASR